MTDLSAPEGFRYDVAFSFRGEDEALAQQLNELLQDGLRTFIYTRRQERLVGTDGEVTLNSVFGSEARMVVVLYRSGWGETPFTRVEQTAIRNRAYDEGYDFALFVPLDGTAVPQWLPRNRIWPNLGRWGLEGLAAVVETRCQELGGAPRVESAAMRASRLHGDLKRKNERLDFLRSTEGMRAAYAQLDRLISRLDELVEEVNTRFPHLQLTCSDLHDTYVYSNLRSSAIVTGTGATLKVKIDGASPIAGSGLRLELYPNKGLRLVYSEMDRMLRFEFDCRSVEEPGWRDRQSGRFYSSSELADHTLGLLLDEMRSTHFG
ncbi:MAG TPA: hypothetical protein VHG93_24540 [Longimicrobium sp.]|nr:hypothetical protein [Longimicrobium sp.]